ncbi:hypothetical protein CFC21_051855 [Triticum aestivum]|uniref:Uncharacterized protein n=2 Tax=Triticum aestivum TaxID=4565 RepID=A0A9R1F4G6_WHEAT|nr:hypothetical protein CFC21_034582 [Triticum aestivum]KAF7042191.1 hypothetical protein CFC21_051855 [Triticum aestivum]
MLRAEPVIPSHVVLGRIFLARLVRSAAIHYPSGYSGGAAAAKLGATMEPACLAMGWESDRRAAVIVQSRRQLCSPDGVAAAVVPFRRHRRPVQNRARAWGGPPIKTEAWPDIVIAQISVRFSQWITGKMKQWPSSLSVNTVLQANQLAP